MQTPCVSVCIMNPVTGTCEGCRRTVAEIAAWASLSDRERARIMAELPGRPVPGRAVAGAAPAGGG